MDGRGVRLKYWSFQVCVVVSRIFGTLNFVVTRGLRVKSSIIARVYNALVFLGFISFFILEFRKSMIFFNDDYRKSIIFVEFLLYWAVSVSNHFLALLNDSKVETWTKQAILALQKNVKDVKLLQKIVFVAVFEVVSGIVAVTSYTQLSFQSRPQPDMSIYAQLIYWVICSNTMVILIQFISGVLLIFIFFREINKELYRGFDERVSKHPRINILSFDFAKLTRREEDDNSRKIRTIHTLSEKHHNCCVLATALNDCYSLQVLLFTGLCFIELTYSIYHLIRSMTQCQTGEICQNHPALVVVFSLFWAGFYGYQMAGCAVSCQLLKDEANRTGILIHKLMNRESDKQVKGLLEIFSLQVHQWQLEITAFGFFLVDNSLLYTMVGGVTSALVILIQFQRYSTTNANAFLQNSTANSSAY